MTYFPDLAPYDYLPLPKGVTALTVGWLDDVHTFPTGDLSAEFVARLFRLCADHTIWLSLGWHVCELCYREGMFEHLASTLGATKSRGDPRSSALETRPLRGDSGTREASPFAWAMR
jgi:hypothetical protein